MRLECSAGIRVNRYLDGLTRTDVVELRLLEVGRHPHVAGDDRHQGLPRLHERALFDRLARHAPRLRRINLRVREFEFGLLDRGAQLLYGRARGLGLSLTDGHLLLARARLRQLSQCLADGGLRAPD